MIAFKHESVGDFYSIQEDWESYVERVSLYLVANDIIDEGAHLENCFFRIMLSLSSLSYSSSTFFRSENGTLFLQAR